MESKTAENKTRFIGLKLSDAEYQELRLLAAAERITQSEAIRRAIREKAVNLAAELKGVTVEELLRGIIMPAVADLIARQVAEISATGANSGGAARQRRTRKRLPEGSMRKGGVNDPPVEPRPVNGIPAQDPLLPQEANARALQRFYERHPKHAPA